MFNNLFNSSILTVKLGEKSGEDRKLYMQITDQSPEVAKFFNLLKSVGRDFYLTQNGIRIKMDAKPEWKDSQNAFYVRGYSKADDLRVDETLFGTPGMKARKIELLKGALEEFTNAVRKASKSGLLDPTRYQIVSYDVVVKNKIRNDKPYKGYNMFGDLMEAPVAAYAYRAPVINWALVSF